MTFLEKHLKRCLGREFVGGQSRYLGLFYSEILFGRISTRREFSNKYKLRPSTVSILANKLVNHKLVYEVSDVPAKRGRPAKKLVANYNRFAVCVIHISSQTLICSAVNIFNQVIQEIRINLPADLNNDQMLEEFRNIHQKLLVSLNGSAECEIIVLSLPGVLDIPKKRWILSSRWPLIKDLDMERSFSEAHIPISLVRNIDAELGARTFGKANESTLLLHWGYGIGIGYSTGGRVANSELGRFGEIGHWTIESSADDLCRCGRRGCVEVSCALWSIWPQLVETWPDLPKDEESFYGKANHYALIEHPVIQNAVDIMILVLGNVCRILFPSTVLLSGPFFSNGDVSMEFLKRVPLEGVLPHVPPFRLIFVRSTENYEISGAAVPLIAKEVVRLLYEICMENSNPPNEQKTSGFGEANVANL